MLKYIITFCIVGLLLYWWLKRIKLPVLKEEVIDRVFTHDEMVRFLKSLSLSKDTEFALLALPTNEKIKKLVKVPDDRIGYTQLILAVFNKNIGKVDVDKSVIIFAKGLDQALIDTLGAETLIKFV